MVGRESDDDQKGNVNSEHYVMFFLGISWCLGFNLGTLQRRLLKTTIREGCQIITWRPFEDKYKQVVMGLAAVRVGIVYYDLRLTWKISKFPE